MAPRFIGVFNASDPARCPTRGGGGDSSHAGGFILFKGVEVLFRGAEEQLELGSTLWDVQGSCCIGQFIDARSLHT